MSKFFNSLKKKVSLTVPLDFSSTDVFIHVSKGPYEDGTEGGVFIHLESPKTFFKHNFYLAGRNSAPESKISNENGPEGARPENPYASSKVRANRYSGSGALKVEFRETITTGEDSTSETMSQAILRQSTDHTLLPCDNNLTAIGVSDDIFQSARNRDAVEAAIRSGLAEIASLTKPVFYQDNRHTLFVEPSVTETTIEEWKGWVTQAPRPEPAMRKPGWWHEVFAIAEIPRTRPIPDSTASTSGLEIDQGSLIKPSLDKDWLLNPQTALQFDGVLLGPTGQPGLQIRADKVGETVEAGAALMKVNTGSSFGSGREVIVTNTTTFEQSGLIQIQDSGGLNVVGNGGFNSALKENLNDNANPKELDATAGANRN